MSVQEPPILSSLLRIPGVQTLRNPSVSPEQTEIHFHGESVSLTPGLKASTLLPSWGPASGRSPQKWLGHCSSQGHRLLSLFQLLCRPAPFICNLQEGGGLGAQEALGAAGGGAGVPLTAEASFTHPATHVPLYGPGFLSVLKEDCEKSRLILAAWPSPGNRPGRRSFFLPPQTSLLSSTTPLFLPPCVLCCVSLKLPSQPLGSQQPGPSGASSLRADQLAPGVQDRRGQAPRVTALCDGTRFKLQLATLTTLREAATTVCTQARVHAAPHALSSPLLRDPNVSHECLESAKRATGHCAAL